MGIFAKSPEDREYYGYKFKWGPRHQTAEELHKLTRTYDELSTKALERLDDLDPPEVVAPRKDIQEAYEPKDKGQHRRDYFKLLQKHKDDDETIEEFWAEVETVPDWVDWEAIARGQVIFWRYGGPSITALTYLSLLGGLAAGRTVETLDRTGGFGALAVRRRLLETVQHTLSVHKDLASIQPGGEGWENSVRVRLLHSSVRRRLLHLAEQSPEYYSVEEYGVPVNDLDCIGTMNTFSSTLIWIGFPRQGIHLTEQEVRDYLALWRYVSYIMGTPHEWASNPDDAKALMESLLLSEFQPTKKSRTLANNIITAFEGVPPIYASRGFLAAVTWWLNGPELAKQLRIPRPSLYHWALAASQCWSFMVMSFINKRVPILDRWTIDFMRKSYYEMFVEDKKQGALGYRTKFTFKWIPDLTNTTTPLGTRVEDRRKDSGAFRRNGLERTALITLILTLASVGGMGYGGFRLANQTGLATWLQAQSRLAVAFAASKLKPRN